MSRWSNSESCKAPPSTSALIAGARSAVIQSSPAALMSSVMRAWVIMPRSPTSTTWSSAKRCLSFSIWAASVIGSAVLPSNTSIATGQPSGGAEQAIDDLQRARLAVAAVAALGERAAAALHVARGHVVEHQRAVREMALGQRRLDGGLALQQPVERGVELVLVDLAETEQRRRGWRRRSPGESARAAASLEAGSRIRPTIMARTRSRQRLPSGPRIRSRPILRAVPRAAATWPCGKRADDGEGFALRRG